MKKEEQTVSVIKELYNLTYQFTHALTSHYYYQFRGDVNDLASEFFTQFITPKGRKGAVKESLLDKFNPETTSLAYLVKVCVTRKLIDQSRQNPQQWLSIDKLVDANGDCVTKAFHMATDDPYAERSSILNDKRFLAKVIEGYNKLPDEQKNLYYSAIFDTDSVLAEVLKPAIRYIRNCPIQQITDKTAVLFIPQAKKLVGFSVEDGHARGSFQPFHLTENELLLLREYGVYHSHFSRELFIEYLSR